MEQNNLPTEQLKAYGIIENDNSFSKKLSDDDVKKFLNGYIIVADNDKNRVTFQLQENNSKLNVKIYQRDKSIQNILEDSKKEIQYSKISPIDTNKKEQDYNVKVFIAQESEPYKTKIKEYNLQKDIEELTQIITEKKDEKQVNRYKNELLKLKGFIQDKIDKFPELNKQLTENINIVSNEIDKVNSVNAELNKKAEKSKIELDVNDPDLYQDANRKREEEQEIEQEVKRGRKR